jgi:hypothetical protein
MSPCSAERLDLGEIAGDQRRRHQVGKFHHEHLLRRVAHFARVVDHQRPRVDAFQQIRRGDVSEVERRVLAQQHHVELGEVLPPRLAERKMAAFLVAHLERCHGGEHLVAAQGEPVGGVIGKHMAPPLRLQQQCECGIAADVDPPRSSPSARRR